MCLIGGGNSLPLQGGGLALENKHFMNYLSGRTTMVKKFLLRGIRFFQRAIVASREA